MSLILQLANLIGVDPESVYFPVLVSVSAVILVYIIISFFRILIVFKD